MALCPQAHARDIGQSGTISHMCSKNRGTKERLREHGKLVGCYGENISVFCNSAQEVIMQLIIDDGRESRSHRNNFFQEDFKMMACATADHIHYERVTVIVYAGNFVKNGEEDPISQQMKAFLEKEVEFTMPKDIRSWKQNASITVDGKIATKTTYRDLVLKDGTTKRLENTEKMTFHF